MQITNAVSSKTKHKTLRIPHEILALIEDEKNQSAALIELLKIGAKEKYNEEIK